MQIHTFVYDMGAVCSVVLNHMWKVNNQQIARRDSVKHDKH